MNRAPIPLSLITGFLGSGKTTLLNALLRNPALKNTAVIINEFGDVGIDHLLVDSSDEDILELNDGCLCCTVRGDLVDTLMRLLKRHDANPDLGISRIVIETTGLADPAPILHAVMAHPMLVDRIRLDGVIALVDAINGGNTLDNHLEAIKQIAMADRIVVTKQDLQPDKQATTRLLDRLSHLNPSAKLVDCENGEVSPSSLFNCGLYDPQTKSADVAGWLRDEAVVAANSHGHHHHDINRHDASIRAFTLIHDEPIEADAMQMFLDLLRSAHGPQLLRIKGIVRTAENPDQPVVIHAVQHIFHPPATLPEWPDEDHRTRLVIITRDLDQVFVQRLSDAFTGRIATDTPDREALENSPLAVPGLSGFMPR